MKATTSVAILGALLATGWTATASAETRTVRLRYEVENTSAQLIEDGSLVVAAPLRRTPTQQVVRVTASHPMVEAPTDAAGNAPLVLALGRIAPYGKVMVTVTVVLEATDEPSAAPTGAGDLEAQAGIEVDNPAIQAQGQALRRPEPVATARAAYDWVRDHVHNSGFEASDRGAAWALANRRGDCSEMAALFVAVARAAGVAARYRGGWVVERSGLLSGARYHNWAEFHDGTTWRVADPQKGIFSERPGRFLATNAGGVARSGPLLGHQRFRTVGGAALTARILAANEGGAR